MSIDAEKLADAAWEPAEQIEGEAVYLRERVRALEDELLAIKLSRSYRVTQRLLRSRYGRLLHRAARILIPDQSGSERQRSRRNRSLSLRSLVRRAAPQLLPATASPLAGEPAGVVAAPSPFSPEEQAWLEHVTAHRPAAIAVLHPHWRGIRTSTQNLFSYLLFQDDALDADAATRVARMIAESGCPRVVLSGFPLSYGHLVRALKQVAPQVHLFVLWHASFLQSDEPEIWKAFKQIDQFCRDGLIAKWGFVKQGMAEIVGRTGVPTGFVMNYVRTIPNGPSQPAYDGYGLGIWAIEPIWRKSPYATLAATSLVPNARVFCTGQAAQVREFIRFFRINAEVRTDPIPQAEMPQALARMHLNLYITLSECAPMLPLESLAVGAPCLLGPTSHYFEDHSYLHSRLVVPSPDRALVIVRYIEQALAERDQIIAAYQAYAPLYNARAEQSVRDFLEVDSDARL
jgi:hypothetical protein